jgi:hypothetical protein
MQRIHLVALDRLPDMWVTPGEYRAMNPKRVSRDACAVLVTKQDGGVRLAKVQCPSVEEGKR